MSNPFFVTGTIDGKNRHILLETGADVSLIGVEDLEDVN